MASGDGKHVASSRAGRHSGRVMRRFALLALVLATPARAQDPVAWSTPTAPFRLVGDVYYVGTKGLAAYLIRTDAGAILIDATTERNVPAIAASIRALGVPLSQVRLILVTHAHFDHAGGTAAMRRLTGAQVVAGARDAVALEAGVPPGETSYGVVRFPPTPVSRRIADGGQVRLGAAVLTAVATPGHTPGCTSWTMPVRERGRTLHVVFPCSVTVAGNRLFANRRYPGIVGDYRASFARLATLPADVVLPSHPEAADVAGRARAGTLVAPGLLRDIVVKARDDFDRELRRQGRVAR